MSRTITALFDTRADAEAGRERLLAAHIDADNVAIHDSASTDATVAGSTTGETRPAYSTAREPGIWGAIKNAFLPDEDRHTYEEGIRRGGYLLTADVDEDEIDQAVAALENTNSVDLDERSQSWRNEGWSEPAAATTPAMFGDPRQSGSPSDAALPAADDALIFGQRDLDRGGPRARAYVTERPVREQMRMRDAQTTPTMDSSATASGGAYGAPVENRTGSTLAGMADEAIGNVKQGIGGLTGDDSLTQRGEAQERRGETQQGKTAGND